MLEHGRTYPRKKGGTMRHFDHQNSSSITPHIRSCHEKMVEAVRVAKRPGRAD